MTMKVIQKILIIRREHSGPLTYIDYKKLCD